MNGQRNVLTVHLFRQEMASLRDALVRELRDLVREQRENNLIMREHLERLDQRKPWYMFLSLTCIITGFALLHLWAYVSGGKPE